nr:hypothetical protein [uncultured Acetatifactor sp.]
MKDTKIQWHPAFVAAMGLELKQNRNDLIFEKEYNLNTKPLEMEELMGDENMYEALMEMMEPRIQQREKAKIEAERKKGIRLAVKSLQDLGTGTVDIKKVIIKNYGLSEEEIGEFL